MESSSTVSPIAGLKEIGDQAVWVLSSAKSGNGVEQIRDENTST